MSRTCGKCEKPTTTLIWLDDVQVCRNCSSEDWYRCTHCGNWDALSNWVKCAHEKLIYYAACYGCAFWLEQLEQRSTAVVVDGKHYRYEPSKPNTPAQFKGHGGRCYTIKFMDGRTIETDNLWCQGEIPEMFRARFPDNATFETR